MTTYNRALKFNLSRSIQKNDNPKIIIKGQNILIKLMDESEKNPATKINAIAQIPKEVLI